VRELNYTSDVPYTTSAAAINDWDWKHKLRGQMRPVPLPITVPDLSEAMRTNPHLKVMSANGWFDLATPFFATEYDLAHMDIDPKLRSNLTFTYYPSGHMVYLNLEAAKQFKADLAKFYDNATARYWRSYPLEGAGALSPPPSHGLSIQPCRARVPRDALCAAPAHFAASRQRILHIRDLLRLTVSASPDVPHLGGKEPLDQMASADAVDRNAETAGGARRAPADAQRYFAFISYSHQDEIWAQWLHKTLETWRVPKRLVGQTTSAGVIPLRLLPIFRDRDELASATDLGRTVNAALAQSKNLIVICSPASAKSRWVNEEVLAFKRLGHAERIFCLVVGGEPNASDLPGREAEECFAPALRFQVGADGQPTSTRTEPIAADARAGKDGKANAKLKLIAGMLDVGFDRLKQRELQRRNRRMAVITVAALVVMVIATTLAITAVIARNDATRRQKQAEDLVGFMLGDLNDKLREVSRLDILQAVDDQAMAYFASLPDASAICDRARREALAIGGVRQIRAKSLQRRGVIAASAIARTVGAIAVWYVMREASYANSLTWIKPTGARRFKRAASNFEIVSRLRAPPAPGLTIWISRID
jgi:hypothetical protein